MMDIIVGLDSWFADRLHGMRRKPETVAYVAGVLKSLAKPRELDDLSKRSVILEFASARETGDFATFQRIGDWVLWVNIVMPESLEGTREAVESVGRQSYYTCHRILRGQWHVYEELADDLPTIARSARHMLV
jgi:hypothetical protein